MKILVTGGAGFIGSHTVVELVQQGFEPVILDNFSNSEPSVLNGIEAILGRSVRFYIGDCRDGLLLEQIFRNEQIQGVIHFAASKAVEESVREPLSYYENNVGSTISVLKTMQTCEVKNLVFSSSCTVYGEPEHLPVTEQTPCKPATSPYGNTKQIGERIIRDTVSAGKGLNAVLLRYFNPIGAHPSAGIGELPRGIPSNLIPFITQTCAGVRPCLEVYGNNYDTPDGSCIRDFIHVVDLAKAHVAALRLLFKQPTGNEFCDVFNIGTGQGHSVLETISLFKKISGQSVNYQICERRAGDIVAIYADVTKSNSDLKWKAQKTLADALTDAWRWQKTLAAPDELSKFKD